MVNHKDKIYNLIKKNKSIFLIGRSDSGKTYFVKNELIPFLKEKKTLVSYFSNCDKIINIPKTGVAIIDEVETFQDKEFLEKNNKTKEPYYNKKYIQKVNKWYRMLKKVEIPTIYIVTRNGQDEIKYFQKNVRTTDWDNRKVEVVVFSRRINNNKV